MKRSSSDGRRSVGVALVVSALLVGTSVAAHAQGVPPPPEAYPPPPQAYPPPPPAPMPPPPMPVAQPGDVPPSGFDFDPTQRRWGVGYSGVSTINMPPGLPTVTVPALGLRYWMGPSSGIDVAVGFGLAWGSTTDPTGYSTDKNAIWGVIVQGGYPIVLSAHKHVCFEVVPYVTFGYGATSTGSGATELDSNGIRVDVGARGGLEVFFGFIGIPELALSATIGAQFEYQRLGQSAYGQSVSDTTFTISTTVQNNPWDFFTGNVSARYYF